MSLPISYTTHLKCLCLVFMESYNQNPDWSSSLIFTQWYSDLAKSSHCSQAYFTFLSQTSVHTVFSNPKYCPQPSFFFFNSISFEKLSLIAPTNNECLLLWHQTTLVPFIFNSVLGIFLLPSLSRTGDKDMKWKKTVGGKHHRNQETC